MHLRLDMLRSDVQDQRQPSTDLIKDIVADCTKPLTNPSIRETSDLVRVDRRRFGKPGRLPPVNRDEHAARLPGTALGDRDDDQQAKIDKKIKPVSSAMASASSAGPSFSSVQPPQQIFVKTLTDEMITFDFVASETIDDVKAKIEEKDGVPRNMQQLKFNDVVIVRMKDHG
jgi:hypothetical protein